MNRVLHLCSSLIAGFNIGVRGKKAHVICSTNEKQIYEAEPGRTEWVTVVECICADGSAIHPLVIFKGKTTVQKAWIPPEMEKDWSWACNTKGWTCDDIGEAWIKQCFEPLTKMKANGAPRLLVLDGHGSHITAAVIRFCMDHNILIVLLPPHSSHLTQPLDVGIFSPLKTAMSKKLDTILRYGVPNIKKFEWANCYRDARPSAFKESNVLSAWSGTGLLPFNPQKIIRRLKAKECEAETQTILTTMTTPAPTVESLPTSTIFNLVPTTPSKLDSIILRSANQALLSNIQAGILDTPTKAYIPKLVALSEHLRTAHTLVEEYLEKLNEIVKKRRVMTQGKRIILKDQILITTEGLYKDVKKAEDETGRRRSSSGRGRKRSASGTVQASVDKRETAQDANRVVILDEIEVLIA